MWFRMCVCVCVCLRLCVCVFAHEPAWMQKHTAIHVPMSFLNIIKMNTISFQHSVCMCVCVFAHVPAGMQKHTAIYVSMSAFIKQWCIICIAHSFTLDLIYRFWSLTLWSQVSLTDVAAYSACHHTGCTKSHRNQHVCKCHRFHNPMPLVSSLWLQPVKSLSAWMNSWMRNILCGGFGHCLSGTSVSSSGVERTRGQGYISTSFLPAWLNPWCGGLDAAGESVTIVEP